MVDFEIGEFREPVIYSFLELVHGATRIVENFYLNWHRFTPFMFDSYSIELFY